jgi:Tfp pilus assembly protein PilE
MDKLSTGNKGISLMQLIVLVIVIGLLAAFLIPFIGSYFREKDTSFHSKENLQLAGCTLAMEEIA